MIISQSFESMSWILAGNETHFVSVGQTNIPTRRHHQYPQPCFYNNESERMKNENEMKGHQQIEAKKLIMHGTNEKKSVVKE